MMLRLKTLAEAALNKPEWAREVINFKDSVTPEEILRLIAALEINEIGLTNDQIIALAEADLLDTRPMTPEEKEDMDRFLGKI